MRLRKEFRGYELFVFDWNGTLWIGEKPIMQGLKAFAELIRLGKNVAILSNNSTKTREGYLKTLSSWGLELPLEDVFTKLI